MKQVVWAGLHASLVGTPFPLERAELWMAHEITQDRRTALRRPVERLHVGLYLRASSDGASLPISPQKSQVVLVTPP